MTQVSTSTSDLRVEVSGLRIFVRFWRPPGRMKCSLAIPTLKLYEGHFHDLLSDLGKEVVMADIGNWIDAHLSALVETKGRTQ
jgi:hypothetical protein